MSASENQIVVYQPNETVRLDVRLENETVWLTQLKIAELFGVQKAAISKHIKNIFASGELIKNATVSKMETVQTEGGRTVVRAQEFFNLDVIIAVGYRVNSKRATQFRIWATRIIKDYLLRGYSVNSRLNLLEDKVDRRMAKAESDISGLKEKVDFFVQTREPPLQGIFYQNRYWDAKSLLIKFIRRAKKGSMFFVCAEERKESVPHVSYRTDCLCKASRLQGGKERRCNRKVAPLKQRFLTRCSRMAVSDAVCVI